MDVLSELTAAVLRFRDERNWAQFHTLRHLIVSLNLEAGELLELTQWQSDDDLAALIEDPTRRQALSNECADVLLYLLLIAEKASIDLADAARSKLLQNAVKYPVKRSYGSSRKYSAATSETDTA